MQNQRAPGTLTTEDFRRVREVFESAVKQPERTHMIVSAGADRYPINEIRFLDLQTKAISTVFRIEKEAQPGFDVSPDGRQILFSPLDRNGADLMLVERFR